MTWNTSGGRRELSVKERELFAGAITNQMDIAVDCCDGEMLFQMREGCPFERLTPSEKCAVLLEVCQALFEKTEECPELTSINESAIHWVFGW